MADRVKPPDASQQVAKLPEDGAAGKTFRPDDATRDVAEVQAKTAQLADLSLSLLEHIEAGNPDNAKQVAGKIFPDGSDKKLKDLTAELRTKGNTGIQLADKIDAQESGTGAVGGFFGRVARAVSSKTAKDRRDSLVKALDELIVEQRRAAGIHLAARETQAPIPAANLPGFNTPAIRQLQVQLDNQRQELEAKKQTLETAKAEHARLEQSLAGPRTTIAAIDAAIKEAQRPLKIFESVRAMTPADRDGEKQHNPAGSEFHKALNTYTSGRIATKDEAKQALEELKRLDIERDIKERRSQLKLYILNTKFELLEKLLAKSTNSDSERTELETLGQTFFESGGDRSQLKYPELIQKLNRLESRLESKVQQADKTPLENLGKAIASAEYEYELTDNVFQAKEAKRLKEEEIQVQQKPVLEKIQNLERQQKELETQILETHRQLNWHGYKVRSDYVQNIVNDIRALREEESRLKVELANDSTSPIPAGRKKRFRERLQELPGLIQLEEARFAPFLLNLEVSHRNVGLTHDELYPKDGVPYPPDPDYSEADFRQFLNFTGNPIVTGGENYRPSISELVRDYQFARQGVTLKDAYRQLFEKIQVQMQNFDWSNPSRAMDRLKEIATPSILFKMVFSESTRKETGTQNIFRLIRDYPLECTELMGHLQQAADIFNRDVFTATGGVGLPAQLMQEYKTVSGTVSAQNVFTQAIMGHSSPLYSEGRLRDIDPALLAAIDFAKYLPYLATALMPSSARDVARQSGGQLVASIAMATGLGLMDRTTAAMLVGSHFVEAMIPESLRSLVSAGRDVLGIYTQVRGEQLAMRQLRYQAEVKGSKIAKFIVRGNEQVLRDAYFAGMSESSLRSVGNALQGLVHSEGASGVVSSMLSSAAAALNPARLFRRETVSDSARASDAALSAKAQKLKENYEALQKSIANKQKPPPPELSDDDLDSLIKHWEDIGGGFVLLGAKKQGDLDRAAAEAGVTPKQFQAFAIAITEANSPKAVAALAAGATAAEPLPRAAEAGGGAAAGPTADDD
ncbi:MAG: hypothetical protein JKY15_04560 [Deltaproteobacteria bacterium]|nr:hypothetical protein [Deltaproteobacteria bacterium]